MFVGFASKKIVRLAALAFTLAAAIAAEPAFAQAPPKPARPPAAAKPAAAGVPKTGECAALPGGRAPVAKIAGLSTALSPRDLDLVYFNKPLADLTDADFDQIGELSKKCTGEGILPPDRVEHFESVVREAQGVRRVTLDKIKHQMGEIAALPIAREKLVRLNSLSASLDQLEPILTRGDIKTVAGSIARQMQNLYDVAPKSDATSTKAMDIAPAPGLAPVRPRTRGDEEN